MDVERLMQDLSVDQLQNIYSNLTLEMDEKKEELRQMVGRRYRDVLDASSTLRRVTQLADEFATNVHQMRLSASQRNDPSSNPAKNLLISSELIGRLVIFVKLYRLIGTLDALSDAIALLLTTNMHRRLSTELTAPTAQTEMKHLKGYLKMMSPRLISLKLKLENDLIDGVQHLDSAPEVSNQLAAIAILKKHSMQQLLDLFLQQKLIQKEAPNRMLASKSLVDSVWRIRRTFECVERVFVGGKLADILRVFRNRFWTTKPLANCIDDEPLWFAKTIQEDIQLANEQCASSILIEVIDSQLLMDKCNSFLESVCNDSQWMVKQKCELFESSEAVINFLDVLLEAFKEKWPIIGESVVVYHRFFGTLLIERFQELISAELAQLERDLLGKFSAIDPHPIALFKKRVPKFDALLACGLSPSLVELVKEFDEGLSKIFECVKRYESTGKEKEITALRGQFAAALMEMLKRMCEACDKYMKGESAGAIAEKSLAMARLYLALLQSRTSVISKCLSANNENISASANMLKKAAEKCFCKFLDEVIKMSAKEIHIELIATLPADPFAFIPYIQEFEKLNLAEVGIVEVPIQINRLLFGFLHTICLKISDHSIGYLCTSRAIRSHIADSLRNHLIDIYEKAVNQHEHVTSRIALQYIFDVRVLHVMFPSEKLRQLIARFESRIDPFDVTLLSTPIAKNARIAAQRYSMLFGHLLLDIPSSKESSLNESYMAVVDVVPRVSDIARFSLIPRLSKHTASSESKMRSTLSASNMQSRKKAMMSGTLGNVQNTTASTVRNTPSLSSFYKLSTSWFANN